MKINGFLTAVKILERLRVLHGMRSPPYII